MTDIKNGKKSSNSFLNKYKIYIYISFILIAISSLILVINYNIIEFNISIFIIIFIIIIILFIEYKNKRNGIVNFISPFRKRTSLILEILFVLLILTLLFNTIVKPLNILSDLSWKDFFGIIVGLMGIIVSIRVYFEVKSYHTINLQEYLEKALFILENSKLNDNIMFIAPTLFLGKMEKLLYGDYLIKKLKEIATDNLKLSMLQIDEDVLKDFDPGWNNSQIIKFCETVKNSDLFSFHCEFYNILELPSAEASNANKYYCELFDFYATLLKKNVVFSPLNNSFLNKNEGFFAIANFNQGLYYLGTYEVYNYDKVHFNGTLFDNKHIDKEMMLMLDTLCEKNAYKQ